MLDKEEIYTASRPMGKTTNLHIVVVLSGKGVWGGGKGGIWGSGSMLGRDGKSRGGREDRAEDESKCSQRGSGEEHCMQRRDVL
jgi:hypothetical protein